MEKSYSLAFSAVSTASVSPTVYFRALADITITTITIRGIRKESSGQDVRATLSCRGYSVTEDIETSSTDVSLTSSIAVSKGESFYFSLISSGGGILLPYQSADDEPIEAYSVSNSGLILQSTSACSFEIAYTVTTEAVWEKDTDVNGGYPYFVPTLYRLAENPAGEIESPKPWWVWKIHPSVNAGYPYFTAIDGEPTTLTNWYYAKDGTYYPAVPYINGREVQTYYQN